MGKSKKARKEAAAAPVMPTIPRTSPSKENGSDAENQMEEGPEVILEVTCGPNKADFHLHKLRMGSKGTSVLFEGSWFTPNGFQFVSGRGTAKDWKRSIKHHGRSLKLLMAKGLVTVTPPKCMCEVCLPDGPEAREKAALAAAQEAGEITPKKNSRRTKETLSEHRASNESLHQDEDDVKENQTKSDNFPATTSENATPTSGTIGGTGSIVFPAPIPVTEMEEQHVDEESSVPEVESANCSLNTGNTSASEEENNNAPVSPKPDESPVKSPLPEERDEEDENKDVEMKEPQSDEEDVEKKEEQEPMEANETSVEEAREERTPTPEVVDATPRAVENETRSDSPPAKVAPSVEPPVLDGETGEIVSEKLPEQVQKEIHDLQIEKEKSEEAKKELLKKLEIDPNQMQRELTDEEKAVLSPQREKRLTNIIEELKNYKKQLVEKIEITKKPDVIPVPKCADPVTKPDSPPVPPPVPVPVQAPAPAPKTPSTPRAQPNKAAEPKTTTVAATAIPTYAPSTSSVMSPTQLASSMDHAVYQSTQLMAYYNQLYATYYASAIQGRSGSAAAVGASAATPPKGTKRPASGDRSSHKHKKAKSPSSSNSAKDNMASQKSLLSSYLNCQCPLLGYKDTHAPTCLMYQYSRLYTSMYAMPTASTAAQLTSPTFQRSHASATSSTALYSSSVPSASTASSSMPRSAATAAASTSQSHTIHYKNSQDSSLKSTYPYTYPFPYTLAMFPGSYNLSNGVTFDKDGAMDLTGLNRPSSSKLESKEAKKPCRPSPVYPTSTPSETATSILDLTVRK